MKVTRIYSIEAAHSLRVPKTHKCSRVHGHNWTVAVTVEGIESEDTGMVIDFFDMDKAWQRVNDALDHQFLNNVAGLDNPTSEKMARWIWAELSQALTGLCSVRVGENDRCYATLEK